MPFSKRDDIFFSGSGKRSPNTRSGFQSSWNHEVSKWITSTGMHIIRVCFLEDSVYDWGTFCYWFVLYPHECDRRTGGRARRHWGRIYLYCIPLFFMAYASRSAVDFFSCCRCPSANHKGTPLQALYPAEILSNDIRAQGMAFQGFLGGLAGFINTYATPVALQNIGWKTYTIFRM